MYSTVQSREFHQNYQRQEKTIKGGATTAASSASYERRGASLPRVQAASLPRPQAIDYEGYAQRLANTMDRDRSIGGTGTYRSNYSAMTNGTAASGVTSMSRSHVTHYMNGTAGGGTASSYRLTGGNMDLSPGSRASHRTTQDFSESSSFDDRYDRKVLRKVKKTRSDRNRMNNTRSQSHQELRTNGDEFSMYQRVGFFFNFFFRFLFSLYLSFVYTADLEIYT